MTREGKDSHRSDSNRQQGGRSSASRERRVPPTDGRGRPVPSIGRSTLWDDGSARRTGPRKVEVPVDRSPGESGRSRTPRTDRRPSALGWFLHRHGWRAYAVPVLIALTAVVILQVGRPPGSTAAAQPNVSSVATVISGVTTTMTVTAAPTATGSGTAPVVTAPAPAAAGAAPTSVGPTGPVPTGTYNLPAAALPPGDPFVAKGRNTWHVVEGTTAPIGTGPIKYTFTVEVEDGIENAQADQDFARLVDSTLSSPLSWIGSGRYTLQRVDSGIPSFRISLTSQLTVRENTLCGWEIHFEASCYARDVKRVAINDARWARGAVSFNGDRGSYRAYAINHEVGHALGFVHQPCGTDGGLAPVMMQQSWSTADDDLAPLNPQLIPMDGKVCKFNPYPYPFGPATSATTPGPHTPAGKAGG